MKGYLLAVSGAVVLSAIINCILPAGKMGNFIKGMTRLFVFSVLLTPLLQVFSKKELSFLPSSNLKEDTNYLLSCAQSLSEEDEGRIASLILNEYEEISLSVEVEREAAGGFALKKIFVKVYGDGITAEEEHIHILTRIEEMIEGEYGFKAEVVWREGE